MFAKHFGLNELPFNNTPDPRFFYSTPDHDEALATLIYTVSANRGFAMLTGEVGTGKTLASRMMLRHFGRDISYANITHSCESGQDMMRLVCSEFGLSFQRESTPAELVHILQDHLLDMFSANRPAVLILDEAHNLPRDAFELLRTIGNLESDDAKLLQVIILGQPELLKRFQEPDMRQLRQRLFRSFHLPALNRELTAGYIRHRLKIAGSKDGNVFSDPAIDAIYAWSNGLPRLINTVCDNAMLSAYSADQTWIDDEFLTGVIKQMGESLDSNKHSHYTQEPAPAPAPAPQQSAYPPQAQVVNQPYMGQMPPVVIQNPSSGEIHELRSAMNEMQLQTSQKIQQATTESRTAINNRIQQLESVCEDHRHAIAEMRHSNKMQSRALELADEKNRQAIQELRKNQEHRSKAVENSLQEERELWQRSLDRISQRCENYELALADLESLRRKLADFEKQAESMGLTTRNQFEAIRGQITDLERTTARHDGISQEERERVDTLASRIEDNERGIQGLVIRASTNENMMSEISTRTAETIRKANEAFREVVKSRARTDRITVNASKLSKTIDQRIQSLEKILGTRKKESPERLTSLEEDSRMSLDRLQNALTVIADNATPSTLMRDQGMLVSDSRNIPRELSPAHNLVENLSQLTEMIGSDD